MVPGVIEPELFGFSTGAMIEMTPEEFGARVLASICEAGLEHHSAGGRLVNYAELPGAVSASLLDLFGVEYSAADVDTLARVAQRDAKNPSLGFDDDSERKHRAATELVRSMADKWVRPVYERLEGARVASSATLSGSSG